MILLYWWAVLRPSDWRAPKGIDDPGWVDIVRNELRPRSIGGVKQSMERELVVDPILKSTRASGDLRFDEANPVDVLADARALAAAQVPCIFFYDGRRAETGRSFDGFLHSAVFLEQRKGNVRFADPTRPGVHGFQELPIGILSEVLIKRITYLRPVGLVKVIKVEGPRKTLQDFGLRWQDEEGG